VDRDGPITGRGAHLLLLDDVLKGSGEARSPIIRERIHNWFSEVAFTRLQPGGAVINLQTCWHRDDLAGRLSREHATEWNELRLRAIAEQDEGFRQKGDALWPGRFALPELLKIRESIGSAAFEALYQQRPAAGDGVVFKRSWWKYYHEEDCPSDFVQLVCSWDTAFKTGAQNDFSVCTIWGKTRAPFAYYLLGFWRGRVDFPALKKAVIKIAEAGRCPNVILIEDEANGQSLIQELKYATDLPITAIKADRDKLTRAQAATPAIEAGQVFLPAKAEWLPLFLDEMSEFPVGVFDDIVDSVVQALNYFRRPMHSVGIYPQCL
jgi:predicted phage terminase large subunit-like protein